MNFMYISDLIISIDIFGIFLVCGTLFEYALFCCWIHISSLLTTRYFQYLMSTYLCVFHYKPPRYVSVLRISLGMISWTCFHGIPLCDVYIPNWDSFRLCDWLSLWCLVLLVNYLPPVYFSTFWQSYYEFLFWSVSLIYSRKTFFYYVYIYIYIQNSDYWYMSKP